MVSQCDIQTQKNVAAYRARAAYHSSAGDKHAVTYSCIVANQTKAIYLHFVTYTSVRQYAALYHRIGSYLNIVAKNNLGQMWPPVIEASLRIESETQHSNASTGIHK
jgi:hypothetical protein